MSNIAEIQYKKGDSEKALDLYTQSLNIAKELGDLYGTGQTLNNMSAIYHNKGEYDYALFYALQSYEILKRLNIPELQRSLDIVSSIRETIGTEDFNILEYNTKLKINGLG